MSGGGAKTVRCFTSAAAFMKGPAGFQTLPAFLNSRWTLAGDQRDERMRLFGQKLLRRLDKMGMPFYPRVGLMDLKTARQRFVTGADPWEPMLNPYLDGTGIQFAHVFEPELPGRCWILFAEVAFDVARLAQIPVMWGGFADHCNPGLFVTYPGAVPDGWRVDDRTYGVRNRGKLDYRWG